jgi:hypothetical protein
MDGQPVGKTDTNGLAHLLVKAPPGLSFRIALDTTAHPALRPQNPSMTYTLGQADDVLLMDQPFQEKKARKKPKKKEPEPQLPQRLESRG